MTNIFFGVANRILILILNFILRTVMIRTIGVVYLGINGTLADIISMLCMADLGLNTAVVYSFYEPLAKNDQIKVAALTAFYRKVYNVIAIGITIIGLSLLPFLDVLIKTKEMVPHLSLIYILTLANAIFSYLFVYKSSILTADQRDYVRVRISMVFSIIKIIFQIVFLLIFKNYIIYLVLTILCTVLTNVCTSIRTVNEYPYIEKQVDLDFVSKKQIFYNIKSVFLYKVSNVLLNATDNSLISMLIGTIYVGYYSNYFLLINSLSIIMLIIYNSTTASVGNLVVTESEEASYNVFKKMQVFNYILCCVVVPCYINLASDCVYIWLGKGFEIDKLSLVAMTINFYLNSVFLPVTSFREAVGLYQQTKYVMLITAFLNVILSIVLSFWLGMAGILFATPIARVSTYVWYEPRLLYKQFFKKSSKTFFLQLALNIFVVVIGVLLSYKLTQFLIVDSVIIWFFKACICGGICLLIAYICYSRRDEYQWMKKELFRIIFKRG